MFGKLHKETHIHIELPTSPYCIARRGCLVVESWYERCLVSRVFLEMGGFFLYRRAALVFAKHASVACTSAPRSTRPSTPIITQARSPSTRPSTRCGQSPRSICGSKRRQSTTMRGWTPTRPTTMTSCGTRMGRGSRCGRSRRSTWGGRCKRTRPTPSTIGTSRSPWHPDGGWSPKTTIAGASSRATPRTTSTFATTGRNQRMWSSSTGVVWATRAPSSTARAPTSTTSCNGRCRRSTRTRGKTDPNPPGRWRGPPHTKPTSPAAQYPGSAPSWHSGSPPSFVETICATKRDSDTPPVRPWCFECMCVWGTLQQTRCNLDVVCCCECWCFCCCDYCEMGKLSSKRVFEGRIDHPMHLVHVFFVFFL